MTEYDFEELTAAANKFYACLDKHHEFLSNAAYELKNAYKVAFDEIYPMHSDVRHDIASKYDSDRKMWMVYATYVLIEAPDTGALVANYYISDLCDQDKLVRTVILNQEMLTAVGRQNIVDRWKSEQILVVSAIKSKIAAETEAELERRIATLQKELDKLRESQSTKSN